MATSEFDRLIEQQHLAVDAFAKGNDEPLAELWSRADDVTLGNPFGPFVRGFEQVAETMKRAAANYRDGEATGFDQLAKHVAGDVAYLVEVERLNAKMGGGGTSHQSLSVVRASSAAKTVPGDSCIATRTR